MLNVKNITKSFKSIQILKDISFSLSDGEYVSLTGRSGSGKSTLLYLISTLDLPSSGIVEIDGNNPFEMSVDDLHLFRNRYIGFVFQFHYLLPELTSLENILLPARKTNQHHDASIIAYAHHLLETFNIIDAKDKLPRQMSGGEQQRVSIARALILNPKYLFADEPTGNLDSVNGKIVMNIFEKINQENNTTIVLVTHDKEFADLAHRQIYLSDGKLKLIS